MTPGYRNTGSIADDHRESFPQPRRSGGIRQSYGLPLARGTLQKYASTGGGPSFHKFGQRCVYRREDLDAWIANKLGWPVTTSSDGEAAADGQDLEGVPELGSDPRDPAA